MPDEAGIGAVQGIADRPDRGVDPFVEEPAGQRHRGVLGDERPVVATVGHTTSGRTLREHLEVPMGGYHATAVICAQMALTLLLDADRIPARHGLLTPAAAGEAILLERLRGQGFQIHPE